MGLIEQKLDRPGKQLDLFSEVLHAYTGRSGNALSNGDLYRNILARCGLPDEALQEKVPVGVAGQPCNLLARELRWHQQTLKHAGILERVEGRRGVWALTRPAAKDLNEIQAGVSVVAFSTKLGVAILGSCETVFARLDAPIVLVVTSPPFPLAKARRYGNVSEAEYVDWICRALEPVVKNLARGGSICLNVSNDIFERGMPSRSLYRERLILALHDRLGLHKMDELVWENPSKAPGPVQWASLRRVQLNVSWEPIYWLTNDPRAVFSDNRRVLLAHTEKQLKLIQAGGEHRLASYCDGAYTIRPGSFGAVTEGRIPRNLMSVGHRCTDQRQYKRACAELGVPSHGATMPLKVASFLVEFLSRPGDLVADPFGGSFTTAKAAERLGRRWLSTEIMAEYVIGGASRFTDCDGFLSQLAAG